MGRGGRERKCTKVKRKQRVTLKSALWVSFKKMGVHVLILMTGIQGEAP